ncbi:hypothetical protein [Devosia sp. A449]
MLDSFLPRAALGAGLLALGMVGGLALTSPAWAAPAVSGCYAGSEGNSGFAYGGNACSAPTGSAGSDRWDTTGFIGLSFSIGDGFNPHLAVGLRHTNVNPSNFVYGGEINASVSLIKGLEDMQVRLLGIAGDAGTLGVGLLGNAGIGWDFGANSLLLNAGLQVPYARFFIDYTVDDSALRAFLEANSYGRIETVQNTLTCGSGTVLANGAEMLQQWASVLPSTGVSGDIFAGSILFPGAFTEAFAGAPSTAFVNGQSCFEVGQILN